MKILHISDLHIGGEENKSSAEMIINAITKSKEKGTDLYPDLLVVTGDFTTKGLPGEFESARKYIADIKRAFPAIKDCVIVPGNHDYLWREDGFSVAKDKRDINYKNFRSLCRSDKLCRIYPVGLPKPIKNLLENYLITCSFTQSDGYALLLIGLNSDMLDSEERAGQGYFEKEQLVACDKLIKYYQTLCKKNNIKLITTAAFHHHILPVSSVEHDTLKRAGKFSLTLDARRVLNFFMEKKIQLAIHGHQHQPSVVCWRDEMKEEGSYVYVASAGSMTQKREDLGDVSRNSFMVYDIQEDNIGVYCFQNNASDWEIMELTHAPYKLPFRSQSFENLPCDVRKNAVLPREIIMTDYSSVRDTSDLFYLFLSVIDCDKARIEILEYTSKEPYKTNIDICGIHHLYGKYDILLKYRAKEGDLYQRNLRNHLANKRLITPKSGFYFMNVSYENQNFKEVKQIPLLKNPEAYINSTWNMATLTVYLGRSLSTDVFMTTLNTAIEAFNTKYNTHIEDIIRAYAVGQDQSVIFELFISCYQFPMLTRFTNLIEDIIRHYEIDKSTHIIYYFDERHI